MASSDGSVSDMSDRDFVIDQDYSRLTDSEPDSDGTDHQPSGKHAYVSACARLRIVPSSHVLGRLSSDRLSLRNVMLSPASAEALSAGLAANHCIRSLNLGSNFLGDEVAGPLLEAVSCNGSLTRLDLSRNSLGNGFGILLAETLSSPASTVRELVVAENLLSDAFVEALSEGMRKRTSPSSLRSLDASSNNISDRSGEALASILGDCRRLVRVNLGWNDLRRGGAFSVATAALLQPGRLVSLELSFNGLTNAVGVAVGDMLGRNASLSVLDLSRNRLGESTAFGIADGLKENRTLRTLKLGWNTLGREGTLAVVRAIGYNEGPLEAVRLENTTSAGMEYEAVCEAQAVLAKRTQWVEVVCEYPNRERTKGSSSTGPVSWMTEYTPDRDKNTAYQTLAEAESAAAVLCFSSSSLSREKEAASAGDGAVSPKALPSWSQSPLSLPLPSRSVSPSPSPLQHNDQRSAQRRNTDPTKATVQQHHAQRQTTNGGGSGGGNIGFFGIEESHPRRPSSLTELGPKKEAVLVPVLGVRLKLRAIEEVRLAGEKLVDEEIVAVAKAALKASMGVLGRPTYLSPLRKGPRAGATTTSDSDEKKEKKKNSRSSMLSPSPTRPTAMRKTTKHESMRVVTVRANNGTWQKKKQVSSAPVSKRVWETTGGWAAAAASTARRRRKDKHNHSSGVNGTESRVGGTHNARDPPNDDKDDDNVGRVAVRMRRYGGGIAVLGASSLGRVATAKTPRGRVDGERWAGGEEGGSGDHSDATASRRRPLRPSARLWAATASSFRREKGQGDGGKRSGGSGLGGRGVDRGDHRDGRRRRRRRRRSKPSSISPRRATPAPPTTASSPTRVEFERGSSSRGGGRVADRGPPSPPKRPASSPARGGFFGRNDDRSRRQKIAYYSVAREEVGGGGFDGRNAVVTRIRKKGTH